MPIAAEKPAQAGFFVRDACSNAGRTEDNVACTYASWLGNAWLGIVVARQQDIINKRMR